VLGAKHGSSRSFVRNGSSHEGEESRENRNAH
jgi:hypothetical protein